jgi:protein-disulfide isomerase
MFTGNSSGNGNVAQAPTQQEGGKVSATIDDDAILGDPDAPVTIIEFSDYECPFCGKFWSETLPSIKSEYIDTGKVKLVFRDFPLTSIHPLAQPAAEATECIRDAAGNKGDEVFYEYHDKIFANQAALSLDNLKVWASEMGYNIDSCLSSGKFKSEVQKDTVDAQSAGGQGTPYFVINGNPLSGAYP